MKNKKNIIILITVLIVIVIAVAIFVFSKLSFKSYDIPAIEEQCIRYYTDRNIRTMDFIDMTSLFGTNIEETSDAVFLSNMNVEEEINSESMMIIVMNTEDSSYYYDLFKSHLDSYMMYNDNEELLTLYENAILVKGKNYVYFIIDKEAEVIEKEINMHYK